jgi:N-acylneuraminate cytidylyltransferase/CMP-N,N'-diacetyllegionaminic acid synthase
MVKILFLLIARGGSKGVPKKNIKKLGKLPVLAYKAISAKKSKYCNRLILSTDSEEIAKIGKTYGAEVPFIRPETLASDEASSVDVVLHGMKWVEENDPVKYEAVCLLEAATPFLSHKDIDAAVNLYIQKKALSVLGMREVGVNSVFIAEIEENLQMKKHYEQMKGFYHTRRQDIKTQYTMNGAIYLINWEYLKEKRIFHSERTYGYIMPRETSVEIDNWIDFYFAESLIEKGIINMKNWE